MTIKRQLRADTRVEQLCNSLRKLAFERGPGAQLPTVSTLCKEFAVSSVTLREALERLEIEQVLYRKRSLGIFVSPMIYRKSIHILFAAPSLISETLSPFWVLLWLRLEQEARRREAFKNETYIFHLVTPVPHTENSVPEDITMLLQTERVHGILVVGLHTKGLGEHVDPPIPCVTFAGGGSHLVVMDGAAEGRLAAQELIRQGCKKLACWMPNMPYYIIPGRQTRDIPHLSLEEMPNFQGFCQHLAERNVSFSPELMRQPHLPLAQHTLAPQEQGYLLAKEVFGSPGQQKPDGLFIADDLLADGALAALEELGIQVGKDLKIVAHANTGSPILFGHLRKVTVIEVNPVDIAQAMFSLLDNLIVDPAHNESIIWIKSNIR